MIELFREEHCYCKNTIITTIYELACRRNNEYYEGRKTGSCNSINIWIKNCLISFSPQNCTMNLQKSVISSELKVKINIFFVKSSINVGKTDQHSRGHLRRRQIDQRWRIINISINKIRSPCQISSDFRYLACRERKYMSVPTNRVLFRLTRQEVMLMCPLSNIIYASLRCILIFFERTNYAWERACAYTFIVFDIRMVYFSFEDRLGVVAMTPAGYD